MSGVKGDPCGNRKAQAPRPAYRGAKTALRAVFRAGEIPAQFFIEYQLRAGHARPLHGVSMGKWDIIIGLRRQINVADVEFPSAFLLVMTNSFR